MLEKPDFPDEKITACLQEVYGVQVVQLAFLPLGADVNTAVYRVVAAGASGGTPGGTTYFLKLRRGDFDEITVALPGFLRQCGIPQVIAPVPAISGQLWAGLEQYSLVLYPFIEGRDAYELELSPNQWYDFGAALKSVHTAPLTEALASRIPRETYSPIWREMVKAFQERVELEVFADPVAQKLAAFLKSRRADILALVAHADRLALTLGERTLEERTLQDRAPEFVLCHSDVHPGNLLIDAGSALYIVDWDEPILAPKERDLMFIGGGMGFRGVTAREEETLFYRGYGPTQIDPVALAYYRFERIVQDIAAFCEEIFFTIEGDEDRQRSLGFLMSNFLPGNTIEMASGEP